MRRRNPSSSRNRMTSCFGLSPSTPPRRPLELCHGHLRRVRKISDFDRLGEASPGDVDGRGKPGVGRCCVDRRPEIDRDTDHPRRVAGIVDPSGFRRQEPADRAIRSGDQFELVGQHVAGFDDARDPVLRIDSASSAGKSSPAVRPTTSPAPATPARSAKAWLAARYSPVADFTQNITCGIVANTSVTASSDRSSIPQYPPSGTL